MYVCMYVFVCRGGAKNIQTKAVFTVFVVYFYKQ